MSAANDTRPVWLTREQRDLLAMIVQDHLYDVAEPRFVEMVDAWDAAPADPAEAISLAIIESGLLLSAREDKVTVLAVLAALHARDES